MYADHNPRKWSHLITPERECEDCGNAISVCQCSDRCIDCREWVGTNRHCESEREAARSAQ